ncbi:MAG: polyprenyl diphosphate synthase [Humidesulfovibrio sp.]|uniref:polyprenyl diphosphate synthase n=1 Tax=Humidesulfovibrio sp. TaxID=2910988 RepID=UPI002737521E|nr:polyprenyl diphosphate synthase [Humidesulfovibrio sp.]MDP2848983.1 polyprenyl diphosphate synthase [Humidesulfovibrio sp.]
MTGTTDASSVPGHIAIIMDGNGRWAQRRGLSRSEGHRAGTRTAKAVVTRCRELGVRHLTLYTFSRENWSRPKDEVGLIFDLLVEYMKGELGNLLEQDIRLKVLGEMDGLPFVVRQSLSHVMSKTAHCRAMTLNLALNYSGREEILRACRALAAKGLAPEAITEDAFAAELYTAGQPDPDLIIRTSGELRLSNYLLFQAAYAEFYFTETLWPDFDEAELERALAHYQSRQRRFGKTGEQVAD